MVRCTRARAPGKLVLLGEYAVLTPGEPGVVMAVDRYAEVIVTPSQDGMVWSDEEGVTHRWWLEDAVHFAAGRRFPRFVGGALSVVLAYLADLGIELSPFRLDIVTRSLSGPTGKYGLGSSAAVVVAVVGGVLAAALPAERPIKRDVVFELALGAHRQVQGGGSGIDVAASVYGGFLQYRAGVAESARRPETVVVPIKPAMPLPILAGDSGQSIQTNPRVLAFQDWSAAHHRFHHEFLELSRVNVSALIEDWRSGEGLGIARIARGRDLLEGLGSRLGLSMETPRLARMNALAKRWGGAAKPSGSGGGDVGVALLPTVQARDAVARAWEEAGIRVLDVAKSEAGLSVYPAG